ncbi:MAG: hypothetical protein U0792_17175 [Gemmataceae bacterium]
MGLTSRPRARVWERCSGLAGRISASLACRNDSDYVRKNSRAACGSNDRPQWKRCWVLTLQTREQHIRREKAISNICTNQGLLSTAGGRVPGRPSGRRAWQETAELCVRKAHYAADDELSKIPGVSL